MFLKKILISDYDIPLFRNLNGENVNVILKFVDYEL